jgi:hypothetical protein
MIQYKFSRKFKNKKLDYSKQEANIKNTSQINEEAIDF